MSPDPLLLGRRLTRRAFLGRLGGGLGALAFGSLLSPGAARAAGGWRGVADPPHLVPKARRVIWLNMAGGPSQFETFDNKPGLARMDGKPLPPSFSAGQPLALLQKQDLVCMAPLYEFRRRGQSGQEISDLLPHASRVADELCIVRSMTTDHINHDPAHLFLSTGTALAGSPSMGSWVLYGLGAETDDLPGYVVLFSATAGGEAFPVSSRLWHSGFLPGRLQGVRFQSRGEPVPYLAPPTGPTGGFQRDVVDALAALDRAAAPGDPEVDARAAAFESAFRMQAAVPELTDLSREPAGVLELYGTDGRTPSFALNCLTARRLAERGVRFIQLYHTGWDHHLKLKPRIEATARETDQACAALLLDLKQRGMLEDTLVVWAGEFGRTPMREADGRDHHIRAFSAWLAGGGVKAGTTVGATDELGYHAVSDPVHVHDLHATMLHLLGLDHKRLTYRHRGRDFRLTDTAGTVVGKLLA